MNESVDTPVETPVQPEVETQNPTPDAPETEVAQPDTEGQEPPKPELTPAEKEAKALKRRVDRLTRERYEERARFDVERQQFRQAEQPAEGTDTAALTEEVVQRRARELVEVQSFNKKCNDVVTSGKKEFKAEFDEAMTSLRDEGVQLLDTQGKPTALMSNVLDCDVPHKVLHYLGRNPEEVMDLLELSPGRQARRLAQIETELSAVPKRSSAPAPLNPLKGGGRASGEPDPDDTKAWVAWRNKQLSKS